MKKLIVPILLLVLASAGLYLYLHKPEKDYSYESFIAQDALIVVTQYDLEHRVEEFKGSPLGVAVAGLEYQLIGRELGLSDDVINRFLEFTHDVAELFDNQLFKTLFGTEATCALYPFTRSGDRGVDEQIMENLLVVARPKHGARLVDLAGWFDFANPTMSTSRYGRYEITRYDLENGRRISAVRRGELLLLSLNETTLRKSLDVSDGEIAGITEVDTYREQIDRFSGAALIVYTDFPALSKTLEDIAALALDQPGTLNFDDSIMDAYRTGMFGAWREPGHIVDRALITFDPNLLDGHTAKRIMTPVSEPRSHMRVDQDTIFYHWTNQFDFGYLLDRIHASGSASLANDSSLTGMLGVTGLTQVQLADLFTGNLTLALKGLEQNQLVPLPLFLVSAKTGDVDLLKSATDKLIEHYSVPVRRDAVGSGGELISWGGVVGIGSLLPAFAFNEDSLIISSSRREIRNYISEEGDHLIDNKRFQTVSSDIMKPSNSISYIELDKLTAMIKEMAAWGGTMIAIKDRELARKSKVLIDHLIDPLLDGLSMYQLIASRKYIENNAIHFESQTILEHGKQ